MFYRIRSIVNEQRYQRDERHGKARNMKPQGNRVCPTAGIELSPAAP